MNRAFNLKTSHRDRIVRANVDLYLQAMQLQEYSVDKFNEMHTLMCINMGYSARALCLAIWRLIVTSRYNDALKSNTLYTVVSQISVEDPTLEDEWNIVSKFVPKKPGKKNNIPAARSESNIIGIDNEEEHKNGHAPSLVPSVKSDPPKQRRNNSESKPNPSNNQNNPNPDFMSELPPHQSHPSHPSHPPQVEYKEESKSQEDIPYGLIRNQSLYDVKLSQDSQQQLSQQQQQHHLLPKFSEMKVRAESWLEKDIHIAILQTNPIESAEGGDLALNAERKRLQDILFTTKRGLKIFFGVLTKDSLIRCIQRGASIVHISGHGPYAKQLKVENKFGRLEDLDAEKIREAIEKGGSSKNGKNGGKNKAGLRLVFVSTCYSEHVAQSFCDAGVPHVVAVHSMVQILDQMATKFASAFYEALIAGKKTVEEAFNNSKAELLLEKETDCCCRHEGHVPDCRCPICKVYRCCKIHHGPNSRCQSKKNIPCCQPNVPHSHSDKFLLLPKSTNHSEILFPHLKNTNLGCERIDSRPPTNIGQANQKIVGRARDTRILVDFLHPDNENQGDVVFIFGRPKIGLTTVALQVARFFIRPWYQAIFLGGVFRINLQNCDDPNALYSYIAQAMNIKQNTTTLGTYSYWDNKRRTYIPYPEQTQKDLHRALSGDDITDPIEFMGDPEMDENNDACPEHYIILDQHKTHKELLKFNLPEKIYQEFEKRQRMLPMEFYIDPNDDDKVLVRRIKFTPPDEDKILVDIKKYGTNDIYDNGSFEFQKLLIIDHINFPDAKLKQFLQKIKRLVNFVKCKLLLCCHGRIENILHRIQQQDVANCKVQSRSWRIKPIQKKDAAKLLLEQARQLYEFDFNDIHTPSTAEETSQFPLFEWLSKSPALIQQCSTVLDRKVPFCVIIKMMDAEPNKWNTALENWQAPLKLQQDELADALIALNTLLTQINLVKNIWSDLN